MLSMNIVGFLPPMKNTFIPAPLEDEDTHIIAELSLPLLPVFTALLLLLLWPCSHAPLGFLHYQTVLACAHRGRPLRGNVSRLVRVSRALHLELSSQQRAVQQERLRYAATHGAYRECMLAGRRQGRQRCVAAMKVTSVVSTTPESDKRNNS